MFEFCRLLFQQWLETEGTSAYICFLSNPQNLDIASFLATVETSPFYVALQNMPSSGQMIMVATSNSCLHSRLWCVFEGEKEAVQTASLYPFMKASRSISRISRDGVIQLMEKILHQSGCTTMKFNRDKDTLLYTPSGAGFFRQRYEWV